MSLHTVNLPSIREFLLEQMRVSVGLYREQWGLIAHQTQTQAEVIPLNQVQDEQHILYVSAIALKLASLSQLSALEIASHIVTELSPRITIFQVWVASPGWIYCRLTEPGIGDWLQYLGSHQWRSEQRQLGRTDIKPLSQFKLQYVHARCCSLLRLGEGAGLIKLHQEPIWQIVQPAIIPWFNPEQKFHLTHLAEQQLIFQLCSALDQISPNWVKLIEACEYFYSSCRILGEVKTQTPQLAQARLGLIAATRSVLEFLLQERCGILAPTEL